MKEKMNTKSINAFIKQAFLRSWLAFASFSVIGSLWAQRFTSKSLLHSDDSYIAGFIFGAFAVIAAGLFTTLELLARKLKWKKGDLLFCYLAIVAVWSIAIWCFSYYAIEGEQIVRMLAIVSLICSILVLPLCYYELPIPLAFILSFAGSLLIGMYLIVSASIHG